jgi:hypothetical protein
MLWKQNRKEVKMGISTILPPVRGVTPGRIKEDVMTCLRRQPGVPQDLHYIVASIAGATYADVERAVRRLEGPVPGYYTAKSSKKEAYVHLCRLNNQAVYIP